MTNNPLRVRNAFHLGTMGLLVALGMLLSACGVSAANTAKPSVAPIPISSLPSLTPTLPSPTSLPDSTATSTPLPSFPDPAGYDWAPVVTGLDLPLDIQNAGDGSGRVFIVEKPGRILILLNDQLLPTPFLDITNEVGSQASEQGLLGLAFHPDYSSTGLFFVNYTDLNGDTVIARFNVSADDPNRADPTSEVDLIHVGQPYSNHNGGGLAFGPDGYLYIGLGDGGLGGDPLENGQNLKTLLGKLLRIDVDHSELYSIPADNPFIGTGRQPQIWAYGLRNPWRFSFDRLTGDLYIADVGQDEWEEIDYVPAGAPGGLNFGWSYEEGNHPFKGQPPADATLIAPVVEYSHASGCSITGGNVYRGLGLPEWQGVYFYGDYCSGTVWGLISTGANAWQPEVLFKTNAQINTFGVDEAGEIYLIDYATGTVLKLSRR